MNKKIIAIHQPNYLPWLGYFYKIYQADLFVFLDDVQYSNEGMHNYTYIKAEKGPFRLKYPVRQNFGDKIMEVTPKDELGWKEKHLQIVESNYCKAEYFSQVFQDYRDVITSGYSGIVDLNIALIDVFAEKLGLKTHYVRSSDFGINLSRTEKILALCKRLEADVYYSGTGAQAYQKEEEFLESGIELRYSVFRPFQYPQLWEGFQSNVSALDYFMNCGYDWETVLKNQDKG
ncbi:MAG: WbqC family protein [Bacteroidales bacterium]|nr:WbqC family protein [Bacteroidales bacterium]